MRQKQTIFATAEAVEEAFYEALENGDLDALMELWCEDEEVVFIHPSGLRLTGITAIRQSLLGLIESGGLNIRVSDVLVHHNATMSVHHLIERLAVETEHGPEVMTFAATNVYLKGPSGWQLYLHQATPIQGESKQATSVSQVLH